MNKIPPQLRKEGFRFVPILNGTKKPIGYKWTTDANYDYKHPVMAGYLAEGHNYGVVTGIGHLIVFDVDDLPRLEELNIINQIPETFTVETGRGGKHFYLLCRGFKDKMVLEDPELKDLDGDPLHLGEIQALGEQVVGPGSLHPNGNYYKVIADVPIATVDKDFLLELIKPFVKKEDPRTSKKCKTPHGGSSIGNLIPIDQVAWPLKIKERKGSEVFGSHPKHDSKHGKNFSVNTSKNCWHCFRHKSGGGPLEWLAVEEGIITCKAAGHGCLNGQQLAQVINIAKERGFNIPDRQEPVVVKKMDDDIAPIIPENARRWSDDLPFGMPGVDSDLRTYQKVLKKGKEDKPVKAIVCDGYCVITEETRDESGEATFTLEGAGSNDGHRFRCTVSGRDFADKRKLRGILMSHFGARNKIRDLCAEMIQDLTIDVKKLISVDAPMWVNDRLAIPGLDDDGFKFNLSRRVPADLSTGDEQIGMVALDLIFKTWPADKAAILVATSLASPVCARWFLEDRFGLALIGTSGRGLKTEALKHVLSIYGNGFMREKSLLRWGEGATGTAIQLIAAACGCLPTGIDNYKGTQKDGPSKFVSIIHVLLEGRERERANRNARLQDSKEHTTTLIVTGEDLPEEASTMARLIPIEWSTEPNKTNLTKLQEINKNLVSVGRMWCNYISGINIDMDRWIEDRSILVSLANESGCINPGRVGTTISILKMIWELLLESPLKTVIKKYNKDFEKGLASLLIETSMTTENATEAAQFVETLRELISSGKCVVLDRPVQNENDLNIIGWRLGEGDNDMGKVAILPILARDAVRRVLGPQAQTISSTSLYRQLQEGGYITVSSDGKRVKTKRRGNKTIRVLVFNEGILLDDTVYGMVDLNRPILKNTENTLEKKIYRAVKVS